MFRFKVDEEIELKWLDPTDAKVIFRLTDQSRSYLREWLPWVDATKTLQDTERYIEGTMQGFANRKSLTTAIIFKGEIVGVAGFNAFDWKNQIAYIGYWLAEDYQGNGIMTRVTEALTTYAIKELSINRVEIRAATNNTKSRSVAEKLGFTYEGTLRQAEWLYDHFVDHAIYSKLSDEE